MAGKKKAERLEVVHPDCAGIDVGMGEPRSECRVSTWAGCPASGSFPR